MSAENKNRLEVQKILRDATLEGMKALGIKGWEVMEYSQPAFISADRVVMLNMKESRRMGWQGHQYRVENDVLQRVEEWIDEQTWEFHIVAKRKTKTKITDTLAEDTADMLITWFSGLGVEELRKSDVAPLRIRSAEVTIYKDDNDLYQKRATFTMKLQVPKKVVLGANEMVVQGLEVYGV